MSVSSSSRKLREAARIILVGAPGVGKGTQSERLMRRYPQLASISTGDLLRDNVRDKTLLGKAIRKSHSLNSSCAIALTSARVTGSLFHEIWITCPRSAHPRPDLEGANLKKLDIYFEAQYKHNISYLKAKWVYTVCCRALTRP